LQDARERYQQALPKYRDIQDSLGLANTLKALGDLERLEGRFQEARELYDQALPIYRDIQANLGLANTLQVLGYLASLRNDETEAEDMLQQALDMHTEIQEMMGVRADHGYLGRHHMRNDRPREAALAFEASLQVLPREADMLGYGLSVQGQLDAFARLNDVIGILSCLKVLANIDNELEERYLGLLNSIKGQNPGANFSDLEAALNGDPDELRRQAVARLAADTGKQP
jgi:tetratricopeptide (TPR) repeat protein